ncbi:hypothetical protein [Azonexus sp.]|uniref:hypothetical protein n=1 Tax=Azonexus sp. TaxID=1872668 RepID=UPI0035B3019A
MAIVTHTVDYHVQQHWGRLNALAWHYYGIAESSYDQFLYAEKNLVPFPGDGDPKEHFASERRLLDASFQTIVFAGMACEAAIYDLAAIQLGDDYASTYLDKLDLVAKWVVVPSLICGQTLKLDGPAINSLRTLTRTRNALVHHKSIPGFPAQEACQRAEDQLNKIIRNTGAAFQAVVLLSLELNRVLKTPSGVLPFFEKTVGHLAGKTASPQIERAINRCREIDAKNAT